MRWVGFIQDFDTRRRNPLARGQSLECSRKRHHALRNELTTVTLPLQGIGSNEMVKGRHLGSQCSSVIPTTANSSADRGISVHLAAVACDNGNGPMLDAPHDIRHLD